MNNELNEEIELLDFSPVSETTNNSINNNPNSTPSSRHINFNQASVNNSNNVSNSNNNGEEVSQKPLGPVGFGNDIYVSNSKKEVSDKTVVSQSVILLIIALVNEFLIAPHVVIRLLVYLMEKIIETLIASFTTGGSTFSELLVYGVFTLLLGYLLFSMGLIVISIYNIIKRRFVLSDMVNIVIKLFIYAFVAGLFVILCDKFLHTNLIELVLRVTTFNGHIFSNALQSYLL